MRTMQKNSPSTERVSARCVSFPLDATLELLAAAREEIKLHTLHVHVGRSIAPTCCQLRSLREKSGRLTDAGVWRSPGPVYTRRRACTRASKQVAHNRHNVQVVP